MTVSAVGAAALSAAAMLFIGVVAGAVRGAFGPALVLETVVAAAVFAGVVFLAAFAAAVAIGVPLFVWLEKAHYRRAWPYFAAALMVQFAAVGLAFGGVPTEPRQLACLLPGLLFALLFSRRIGPVWRAAQIDERGAPRPRLN